MINQIKTKRLILRNYIIEDINNVHRLKSEPMVWCFSTNVASSKMEDSEIYLKGILNNYSKNNCAFQALFLKETGEYIGEAGILAHIMPNNRVVVGYNLLPEYWGNGYATEITKALVKYLFGIEKVERIEVLVADGNGASRKVLEKSGFMQEGLLRNFGYIHNRLINVYYYGIIRDDYSGKLIES